MKSNNIIIFGGSFNPIHNGHINAIKQAYKQLNASVVYIVPKKYDYDNSLIESYHRLNMLNLATKKLPYVKICYEELNSNIKYSYYTLKKIKENHPNDNLYFLIGSDKLSLLPKWYRIEQIATFVTFACFKRAYYKIDENIVNKYNIKIIKGKNINYSSTLARTGQFDNLNKNVKNYLIDNNLYLEQRIKSKLSIERYNHVLSTAILAKRIAKANNINPDKAYIAGLMHDIAKGLDKQIIIDKINELFPDLVSMPSFSYHAYLSAYITKNEYKIDDISIYKAIFNHARPVKNMSKLEKIIYVADKLEETRPFASREIETRNLAFTNLDLCFIKTMEEQIEYLKSTNKSYDNNTLDMIKYYKEKIND